VGEKTQAPPAGSGKRACMRKKENTKKLTSWVYRLGYTVRWGVARSKTKTGRACIRTRHTARLLGTMLRWGHESTRNNREEKGIHKKK